MRTAQTVLTVIQERGKQHKPIERVYKLLFNRDFYLNAYAKLYPNNGAMTKGVTDETVDGMSIQKIDRMIELLREEKYQWKPARREYIPKKNGKKRPLGTKSRHKGPMTTSTPKGAEVQTVPSHYLFLQRLLRASANPSSEMERLLIEMSCSKKMIFLSCNSFKRSTVG